MSVCLDTNVLLAGSLGRQGPSAALHRLLDSCAFMVPDGVLAEAIDVLSRHVDKEVLEVLRVIIDDFCSRLEARTLRGYPPVEADGHVKSAAADADCSAICTYDTDDFNQNSIPAWTPLQLFKRIDPLSHLLESPRVGKCGTYMLLMRTWGGETGRLVFDAGSDSAVWLNADGKVSASGSAISDWHTHSALRLGSLSAVVLRYRPGNIEVLAWSATTQRPEEPTQRALLGKGNAQFIAVPRLGIVPNSECFATSSVPIWLNERSIKKGIAHETLEIFFGRRGVKEMLDRMRVITAANAALVVWQ